MIADIEEIARKEIPQEERGQRLEDELAKNLKEDEEGAKLTKRRRWKESKEVSSTV